MMISNNEKESNRWVIVSIACALGVPIVTQIGEGIREYLRDKREHEKPKKNEET